MDNSFEKYFARIFTPTLITGVFSLPASLQSNRVDPGKMLGHTVAYVCGRESVRLMRAGDQDDLLNSIVGGLVGGACHGVLHYRRIGLAGVGRYAAMYSVVGTAVDYATSGLRSALDRQMDAEYAAARKAALSRREEGRGEPPLTGIGTVKDDAFLRSCCRVYFPSLLAGLFCEPAHMLSKGKIPVDFFTAFRHTAAYIGGRELVRLMRAGDQDDLLNSIVGGLVGGAYHGFLCYRRIGLAGVGRYAAMYSVIGTAVDYATSGLRSAFDRKMDAESAAMGDYYEQVRQHEERIKRKDSMIGEFDIQGYLLERIFNTKFPDGGSEGCSVWRDDE